MCNEKKGWMKPYTNEASTINCQKLQKGTKLTAIACDVKLEVIFCGMCVHDLCFLACYENDNYSLLTMLVVW
jgi:hypothetical protein